MFIVNVEGAIHRNGKWLLIKRSEKEEHAAGAISMVGGKCDQEGMSSDILERTLKREIYEEVGIKVNDLTYVNSSSFVTDKGTHVIDIVFLCEHISGEPYAKSEEEVAAVMWMSAQEVLENQHSPGYLKENIRQAELVLLQGK
ncbi:ADP-ribose pyrophosphatase YjhB, NUDIX family [Terribacillus aidingensis]|uniref:ADP-ribose pyrophosphatase YjhB, NUDIX family n=1 Tax=Terribacillus aidingensis TaxID=586416 RepID=A0A285NZ05_9BACI|nr:NUDIX domain-containing protein [Terribacillus aidingensis]SNZ14163.1 ADP-ribose pyrophosphatase YjhB, NUDIX family [Terribacillus aidingensis]